MEGTKFESVCQYTTNKRSNQSHDDVANAAEAAIIKKAIETISVRIDIPLRTERKVPFPWLWLWAGPVEAGRRCERKPAAEATVAKFVP